MNGSKIIANFSAKTVLLPCSSQSMDREAENSKGRLLTLISVTTANPRYFCMWMMEVRQMICEVCLDITKVNFDYFRNEIAEVAHSRIVPAPNIFNILLIFFFFQMSAPTFFGYVEIFISLLSRVSLSLYR